MELLLFGALALAGSLRSKRTQVEKEPYAPFITETEMTVDKVNEDMHETVKEHMQDPYTVTTTNQVPFFRSERSQNTNDAVKDRRLATFTGVNMIEFEHKQEVEAPVPTPDLTNVYGSVFVPDVERYQTYVENGSHNNTTPFETQRVGPGLGLKNEETADGGFHQFYRIKPGNVNGYRKHNYEGRVIHGKNNVDNRTNQMEVLTNTDRTFEPVAAYRALDSKQSTVNAQAINSPTVLGCTNRDTPSFINGVSTGINATYNVPQSTREDSTTFPMNSYGNPHSQTVGLSSERTYMMHSTERETMNNQIVNASRSEGGTYVTSEVDSHTMREQSGTALTNTTPVSFSAPSIDRSGYEANPTLRYIPTNDYLGNANQMNGCGGYVHSMDAMRPTLRDGNDRVLHGPANGGAYGSTPYSNVYTGSQCSDKKEHTLTEYTPNSNTQNIPSDPSTLTVKCRNENQTQSHHIPSNSVDPQSTRIQPSTTTSHKSDVMNTRDFGYAQTILKNNPLSTDITK